MQKGDGKNFPKSHLKQPSAIISLFQTFKLKPGDHIPHRALSSFFSGVPAILSSALTLLPGSTEALPSAATRNIYHAAHIQSPRPASSHWLYWLPHSTVKTLQLPLLKESEHLNLASLSFTRDVFQARNQQPWPFIGVKYEFILIVLVTHLDYPSIHQ